MCIRTDTFPLPSVAQGDSVLLLSVCWNSSRAADPTAVMCIRFSALHCSLMPGGKNNLVPVSAGFSVAVKLANGRLAGVPGRGKGGRKQGWEKQGRTQ